MEEWKCGKINFSMMIEKRKNINRGYRKLHVWQDAVELYALVSKNFSKFPYHLTRVSSNAINASQSISRNISEGYCRRSIKEYLQKKKLNNDWNGSFIPSNLPPKESIRTTFQSSNLP